MRSIAIAGLLSVPVAGCVCSLLAAFGSLREWKAETAPFQKLGARIVATGGGDMGFWSGRAGVGRIYFGPNVGDAELALLGKQMERFPNLHTVVLEGPSVTDAGLQHLRGLSQLKTLILRGTNVTASGKSELKRVLVDLGCD